MRTLRSHGRVTAVAGLAWGITSLLLVAGVSAARWDYVDATRSVGEASVRIQLWYRGQEAVSIETSGGSVIQETRCQGGQLITRGVGSASVVIRSDLPNSVCVNDATGELLGFSRAVQAGLAVPLGTRRTNADGHLLVAYGPLSSQDPFVSFELDQVTGLPAQADLRDGTQVSWTYSHAPAGEPPAYEAAPSLAREIYRPLDAAGAAPVTQLNPVPNQIAGFRRFTAFEYDADTGTGPAYYVIWKDASGRDIQFVANAGAPPAQAGGYQDLGGTVEFVAREPHATIQIFAPDVDALRSALTVLRPGDVDRLNTQLASVTR